MVTKTFSAETPNWGDWSNGSHEISWDRDVYQRDFIPPKELEISIELLTTEPGESPVFVFRFRVEEVLNKKAADFEASLFSNLNLLQENRRGRCFRGRCGRQCVPEIHFGLLGDSATR